MTVPTTDPLESAPVTSDVPLILEDLLGQIEDLQTAGGDATVIADLWARVQLLQGR